jgi:hypothetical protein
MGGPVKRKWLGILAGGVMGSLIAVSAMAGVKLKSDLDGWTSPVRKVGGLEVTTGDGTRGWRAVAGDQKNAHGQPGSHGHPSSQGHLEVDLEATGLNQLTKGAIEVTAIRDTGEISEQLWTFMDDQGQPVLGLGMGWESDPDIFDLHSFESGIETEFKTWTTADAGDRYLTSEIPLPEPVSAGEKFRVTLTWGPNTTDNALFLNGKRFKAELAKGYDFVRLLKMSSKLVFGVITSTPRNGNEKQTWDGQMTSVIVDVKVRDVPSAREEEPVVIAGVDTDAFKAAGFSGKLVAGNELQVTVAGTTGASGTFDLVHFPDVTGKIDLDWRGWGVYLEDKVFYGEGEVNLRDVEGYKVYASTAPFDPAAPNMEPLTELKVDVQNYTFENLTVDTPYYLAAVALMRDGTTRTVMAPIAKQALTETDPGVYVGSYRVGWQDRYPRAVVVGRLESGGVAVTAVGKNPLVMDPGLTIAVVTEPSVLKADEVSKAKVAVTVTNANGDAVSGHKMKFLLATTSQYTGVVGGGVFADQVGGKIADDRWLETDMFGKVEIAYVAGFAAKTAIIVARDMASNSTGSGLVKTYISATAQLELLPVQGTPAMDKGYAITVTSSDEWLTADGKSQARITARVTLNDKPVEGHNVGFSVSSGSGSVRAVKDTTDKNGEARAVYTAGKKIGIVLITANDTTVDISGTVAIELRSDAPAKIAIKLDPEKLPADGRSRADLSVLVTDINDNPNDNTEVEYQITSGSGRLRQDTGLTDKNGESATQYTAGRTAGTVVFEITVRSTEPTEIELAKARSLALAVTDYKFF